MAILYIIYFWTKPYVAKEIIFTMADFGQFQIRSKISHVAGKYHKRVTRHMISTECPNLVGKVTQGIKERAQTSTKNALRMPTSHIPKIGLHRNSADLFIFGYIHYSNKYTFCQDSKRFLLADDLSSLYLVSFNVNSQYSLCLLATEMSSCKLSISVLQI